MVSPYDYTNKNIIIIKNEEVAIKAEIECVKALNRNHR